MEQQALILGYATEESFLPQDNQIYISETRLKRLNKPFILPHYCVSALAIILFYLLIYAKQ